MHELTNITNKKAKGKKGTIVAILAGTKAEPIIEQFLKIPRSIRNKVKEITLDMANSMKIGSPESVFQNPSKLQVVSMYRN